MTAIDVKIALLFLLVNLTTSQIMSAPTSQDSKPDTRAQSALKGKLRLSSRT